MELDPSFLATAVAAMEADPRLGGVAGLVEEVKRCELPVPRPQASRHGAHCRDSANGSTWAGCIVRRRCATWDISPIATCTASKKWIWGCGFAPPAGTCAGSQLPAVKHHGREEGNWALLARRWKSRYLDGAGELLRAAWAHRISCASRGRSAPFRRPARLAGAPRRTAAPAASPWLLARLLAVVALVGVRAVRSGSLADAWFGQVVWQVTAIAMIRGFVSKPQPLQPIEYNLLATPDGV